MEQDRMLSTCSWSLDDCASWDLGGEPDNDGDIFLQQLLQSPLLLFDETLASTTDSAATTADARSNAPTLRLDAVPVAHSRPAEERTPTQDSVPSVSVKAMLRPASLNQSNIDLPWATTAAAARAPTTSTAALSMQRGAPCRAAGGAYAATRLAVEAASAASVPVDWATAGQTREQAINTLAAAFAAPVSGPAAPPAPASAPRRGRPTKAAVAAAAAAAAAATAASTGTGTIAHAPLSSPSTATVPNTFALSVDATYAGLISAAGLQPRGSKKGSKATTDSMQASILGGVKGAVGIVKATKQRQQQVNLSLLEQQAAALQEQFAALSLERVRLARVNAAAEAFLIMRNFQVEYFLKGWHHPRPEDSNKAAGAGTHTSDVLGTNPVTSDDACSNASSPFSTLTNVNVRSSATTSHASNVTLSDAVGKAAAAMVAYTNAMPMIPDSVYPTGWHIKECTPGALPVQRSQHQQQQPSLPRAVQSQCPDLAVAQQQAQPQQAQHQPHHQSCARINVAQLCMDETSKQHIKDTCASALSCTRDQQPLAEVQVGVAIHKLGLHMGLPEDEAARIKSPILFGAQSLITRWKSFVWELTEALLQYEINPDDAASTALASCCARGCVVFKSITMCRPELLMETMATNLETGEPEVPSDGHWLNMIGHIALNTAQYSAMQNVNAWLNRPQPASHAEALQQLQELTRRTSALDHASLAHASNNSTSKISSDLNIQLPQHPRLCSQSMPSAPPLTSNNGQCIGTQHSNTSGRNVLDRCSTAPCERALSCDGGGSTGGQRQYQRSSSAGAGIDNAYTRAPPYTRSSMGGVNGGQLPDMQRRSAEGQAGGSDDGCAGPWWRNHKWFGPENLYNSGLVLENEILPALEARLAKERVEDLLLRGFLGSTLSVVQYSKMVVYAYPAFPDARRMVQLAATILP